MCKHILTIDDKNFLEGFFSYINIVLGIFLYFKNNFYKSSQHCVCVGGWVSSWLSYCHLESFSKTYLFFTLAKLVTERKWSRNDSHKSHFFFLMVALVNEIFQENQYCSYILQAHVRIRSIVKYVSGKFLRNNLGSFQRCMWYRLKTDTVRICFSCGSLSSISPLV